MCACDPGGTEAAEHMQAEQANTQVDAVSRGSAQDHGTDTGADRGGEIPLVYVYTHMRWALSS